MHSLPFDHATFYTPKTPTMAGFGPFQGTLLAHRTPAHCAAGRALMGMHTAQTGTTTLRDDWMPPTPQRLPNTARLRVFDDGSVLLGRAAPGGTVWHPCVFSATNPILRAHLRHRAITNTSDPANAVRWKPDQQGGFALIAGSTPLQRAWPEALAEVIEHWDTTLGAPADVRMPGTTLPSGQYSPAAPFPVPCAQERTALAALLDALLIVHCPDSHAYLSVHPHQPGLTGRATGGQFAALPIHNKSNTAIIQWIKKAQSMPNWPITPGRSLCPHNTAALSGHKKPDPLPPLAAANRATPPSAHETLAAHRLLAQFGLPCPKKVHPL